MNNHRRLLREKSGILLDVSFGGVPQAGAVVLSRDLQQVPTDFPWPIPAGRVHTAIVTHVLEYLEPASFFDWWDEVWRVLRLEGLVHVSGPYGGDDGAGWLADPTHRTRVMEPTFGWLDPRTPLYSLHAAQGRRPPKPWHALAVTRIPGAQGAVGYNVTLQKVKP